MKIQKTKQGTGIENYPKQTGKTEVEWSDTEHVKKLEKKANLKNQHTILSVRKNIIPENRNLTFEVKRSIDEEEERISELGDVCIFRKSL